MWALHLEGRWRLPGDERSPAWQSGRCSFQGVGLGEGKLACEMKIRKVSTRLEKWQVDGRALNELVAVRAGRSCTSDRFVGTYRKYVSKPASELSLVSRSSEFNSVAARGDRSHNCIYIDSRYKLLPYLHFAC